MPALLDKGNFDAWLRAEKGQELLKPANDDLLEAWPVSRRVNKTGVGDDDPTIIEKIELELPTGQLRKETSHASVLLSRNCHTSYGPRLFLDGANSRTDGRTHRHSRADHDWRSDSVKYLPRSYKYARMDSDLPAVDVAIRDLLER